MDGQDVNQKKVLAGVLGILLGSLGIHKFVLGYTTAGIIMLLVTLLACVMGIIGLIEGIIYLTTPDEKFAEIYIRNQRMWF